MKEKLEDLVRVYRLMADLNTASGKGYAGSIYAMIADDIQEVIDNVD